MKLVYQSLVGPQKAWILNVYEKDGVLMPVISRVDEKFFRVVMATKGYDRPVVENFGPANVCLAVDKDGKVAVEPEKILLDPETGDDFGQDRVLRASFDNPKYQGLPKGMEIGEGYPDGQRVVYRDSPVSQLLTAVETPPMREVRKGEFAPCQMLTLFELSTSMDIPGKAALFDALITFFQADMETMMKELYKKLTHTDDPMAEM